MKKQLLLTAIAVGLSLCGYAQTKGTSTLGLGANVNTNKSSSNFGNSESINSNKNRYISLGYGYFIKDNTRIGLELSYGKTTTEQTANDYLNESKRYGGAISYQKYYPLIKTLYAYAGGRAGYARVQSTNQLSNTSTTEGNDYNLGAYGGITWFVSKRFAFETNLLSADVVYNTTNIKHNDGIYQSKNDYTNFNLNTSGIINDLGFKIYLLF